MRDATRAACNTIAPKLEQIDRLLKPAGVGTEVVYARLEESGVDMHRYMRLKKMPRPAFGLICRSGPVPLCAGLARAASGHRDVSGLRRRAVRSGRRCELL